MAAADYYLCDVCGCKAFYDAQLNYDLSKRDKDGCFKLENVGDMAVLCDDCAETHEVVIQEKSDTRSAG